MVDWVTADWENEIKFIARREQKNRSGSFELTEIRTPNMEYIFPDHDLINQNLRLIYGVGEITAVKLNQSGYRTVTDLLHHPRWQKAAADITRLVATQNVKRLEQYGAADLELLSFFRPEDITFIDIETLGFYYMFPVFLIGVLQFVEGQGIIRQFFARNYDEEAAILNELDEKLRNRGVLVSYNGRTFDIPYLKGRLRTNGLDDRFDAFHLDLLRHTRRNYRDVLPDCRLVTVERCLLGDERVDDLPGSEAPEHYQRFLDTGNRELIEPVLKHNAYDLLTMAKYLGLITLKKQKRVAAHAD
ncbi:MAG TPA: ribonuclease H-like domain-containing protein [Bacillota bacterium]|nr:ribonuclease H-like domain-containing protein [Bacillota bacterium]